MARRIAKVEVAAVWATCPACGSAEVSDKATGSMLIDLQLASAGLVCQDCGQELDLPKRYRHWERQ